jgi:hypothetical protein
MAARLGPANYRGINESWPTAEVEKSDAEPQQPCIFLPYECP